MSAFQDRNAPAPDTAAGTAVAWRLAAIVGVLFLAALNRKLAWPALNTPALGVLRLRDVLVMLLFTPVVLLQSLGLFRRLGGFRSPPLTALFVLGGYLLGMGFGMHEPFNRLHILWRTRLAPDWLGPVVYFDDGLGHWIFFAGFACIVLAGVGAELSAGIRTNRSASMCAAVAGLALAAIVFANMWRERTTIDLVIMGAVCAGTALFQARLAPRQHPPPLTTAVYLGFGGGTLMTLAVWALRAVSG